MTNHFAVRSSADWLYTNSHNAPPRDHYRVSIGPVFTFGGRAEVAKAAIGTTAATATTKNPAAFRPVVPVPALGIQVTTRDEGGTEIAEVASGSAAELANLHVGLRDYIRGRQSSQQPDGTHGRPTASHARFAGSFGVYVP